MDKGYIVGVMEESMWVGIMKIKNKVLGYIIGLTTEDTKVNGKTVKETVLGR